MRSALSKLRLADRRGRNISRITTTFSSHAAGDGDSTPESIPTDTPRSISSPISLPPSPLPPHTPRSIPSPISLPPSPLTTPSELEERRRSLYDTSDHATHRPILSMVETNEQAFSVYPDPLEIVFSRLQRSRRASNNEEREKHD
ncbi:unnamed protein product [Cochlearia groenlandica]